MLNRIPYPSPNYSSRGGARVTRIVVHTAEGATTIASLGAFFANPASGVSSHVGIDDTPNTVGEYVRRDGKAWTAANANPWSVQAELCAFAAWDAATWASHPVMLENCAAWIAEEAAHYGIPIIALDPAQAQNPAYMGVCQHRDLGTMGGNHSDCGPHFPMAHVLDLAAGRQPQPPIPQEQEMVLIRSPKGAVSLLDGSGKKIPIFDVETYAALQSEGGLKSANITQRDFDNIPNAF
jgi:hypothetical protein